MVINYCPQLYKDLKKIGLISSSDVEDGDIDIAVSSIPLVESITTLLTNALKNNLLDHHSNKYFKQPFLKEEWIIRKMRFATDTEGKRGGLRIIFCLNSNQILLVLIKKKRDCLKEELLEKEIIKRIKDYIF